MKQTYILECENILVKTITYKDLENIRELRNKDDVRQWFVYSELISADEQIAWYDKYRCKQDDYMFVATDVRNNQFIGAGAIYNIDYRKDEAEFGRLMVDRDVVKVNGMGQAITRAILTMAFAQLLLQEIFLEVYTDNIRAIQIYEALGFVPVKTQQNNLIRMVLKKSNFNF